nr:tetratricopeptide repeat protein [Desulfobulbaceae bacterium]
MSKFFTQNRILIFFFLSGIFLLAFNKIHDTDAWLHLSLGKLIWTTKGFPVQEQFVYTNFDTPFRYTSWLFAVLFYLLHQFTGAFGLVFIKASIITTVFLFLLKDSLRQGKIYIALPILFIAAIVSQSRFVLRPDIMLMFFLASTFYIFNAYLYENKKYVYGFPLLLCLWANTHSSVNLIFAITGAYLVGSLCQPILNKKFGLEAGYLTTRQLNIFLSILAFSILLSLINPNGIGQYLEGAQVLGTDFFKQELSELLPPSGELKFIIIFFETTLLASFIINRKKASLTDFLIILPFLIMPFLARRFFYLPFIVGAPILIKNISAVIAPRSAGSFKFLWGTLAFLLGCLVLSVKTHWQEISYNSIKNFGSGFNYVHMPKEAVDFMDNHKIIGRTFNSFAFGQYIIWTGHPLRTVFVDARGAVPINLLEKLTLFRERPAIISELYQKYKFETILIPTKKFTTGLPDEIFRDIDASFSHPDWALVYWDDKSMLYLRRGGPFSHIITENEYRFINPDMAPQVFLATLGGYKDRQNKMMEIKRNLKECNSNTAQLLSGLLHLASGQYGEAIADIEIVAKRGSDKFKESALGILGDLYFKTGQLDKSLENYFQTSGYKRSPSILHNIGNIYMQKGVDQKAVQFFEKALNINENYRQVYPDLIASYKKLKKTKKIEGAQKKYGSLTDDQLAKQYFTNAVKAHVANDLKTAASEYNKSLQENPLVAITHANLGFVYFDQQRLDDSFNHFTKALEIDPDHANAYYGLGMIYKDNGQAEKAIVHLEKYCDLEPRGHYNRMAKELIKQLTEEKHP